MTPAGEEDLKVWEFTIDLRVVALKGSIPNQWVEDFKQVNVQAKQTAVNNICFSPRFHYKRQASMLYTANCLQALGKYGILQLQQKGQLQDIYTDLGQEK